MNKENMNKNQQNLKTLALFHYIYGGLALLVLSLIVIVMIVISATHKRPHVNNFITNLSPSKTTNKTTIIKFDNFNKLGHSPVAFNHHLQSTRIRIGLFSPILWVGYYFISGILNIISGSFINRQQNRTLSLIVAGFNVLSMPLGTILGVFTFVLLSKNETIELYDKKLK